MRENKISDIPIMICNMPKDEIWFGYIRETKIKLPKITYYFELLGRIINMK